MAKKKEVKKEVKVSSKINNQEAAKAHTKRVGLKADGFKECFVCQDGNIFTNEASCTTHARKTKQPYFKVQL